MLNHDELQQPLCQQPCKSPHRFSSCASHVSEWPNFALGAQCGHRLRDKTRKKKPKSSAAVCFCETGDGLDLSSDSIISRKIAHVYLLRPFSGGIRNADGEYLGVTNHWIHRHYHHYRPHDAATAGWLAGRRSICKR